MILVWRGWGLLAMIGLVQFLAAVAFLSNADPHWLLPLALCGGFMAAGLICIHCGTRWNRPRTYHSMYGLPLQVWGWLYLILAGLCLSAILARAIREGLDRPGRLTQALAVALGLGLLVGLMALTARATRRQSVEVPR